MKNADLQVHDQAVDLPVLEGLEGGRVVVEDLRLDGGLDDVFDELEARGRHSGAQRLSP